MPAARNLAGQRFGRLIALRREGSVRGEALWIFTCDCGAQRSLPGSAVTSGNTASCGCLRRLRSSARTRIRNLQHGMSDTSEYRSWRGMIQKRGNPASKGFKENGAKGVAVCAAWRSFDRFFADLGPRPAGGSLVRVDAALGYDPGNCRWGTAVERAAAIRSAQRRGPAGSGV